MGRKPSIPSTPALRLLREAGVEHALHPYPYVPRGGAAAAAAALGVELHAVVKTLVLQDDAGQPLVVCMHGDREVGLKALARQLQVKAVAPCAPEVAQRYSGYQVGGTSPFGLRRAMPVYVEQSVLDLPRIWINGGARGLLVSLAPRALVELLGARPVQVAG